MYRILVTGPRTWTDKALLGDALAEVVAGAAGQDVVMINGMCEEGADWMAFKWAKRVAHIGVEEHPADWRRRPRMAGYFRNQAMVDAGADICVAFLLKCDRDQRDCWRLEEHWTHGTDHCMSAAAKAGIPIRKVEG